MFRRNGSHPTSELTRRREFTFRNPKSAVRNLEAPAARVQRFVTRARHRLPDVRNKTLRPCRVSSVFVPKLLGHHSLFRADTKCNEDRERDQVRETCHPVWDNEGLADGVEGQRRVHRVADPAMNALRDKSMPLAYLQSDRPIRTEISVRPIEEPEAERQAHHASNQRAGAQLVLSEPERR